LYELGISYIDLLLCLLVLILVLDKLLLVIIVFFCELSETFLLISDRSRYFIVNRVHFIYLVSNLSLLLLSVLNVLISELHDEDNQFFLGQLVLEIRILGIVERVLLDLVRAKE